MNQLYKDGKKIIMRKIGFFCLLLCVLLGGSAYLYGMSAKSLLEGSKDFADYESYLYNRMENENLNYAYVHTDIEMITGSYAQYGEGREESGDDQIVYYLMPINNGEFFVTIIAYGDIVSSLDQMEESFYQSIGNEIKNYPDPIPIKGGFRRLNEEELTFALDYFKGYDTSIETIDDLSNVFSYYALTIDEIHSVSVDGLRIILLLWILLLVLLFICIIVYQSKVMMVPLNKDMDELSAVLYEQIDTDYAKAKRYDHLKLGERMLYVKTKMSMHVYDYDRFIWLYDKEVLSKRKRSFEICAYDKQGKRYVIWQGDDEQRAKRLAWKIMEHCDNCMYGYQSHLYEFWKRYPKDLYEKCVEMSLIREKVDPQDSKKKVRQEKNKEEKRNKKKNKQPKSKGKQPRFKKTDEDVPRFRK